jgi:hypothetical protein
VREELKNVMKFWLDLGADGFRVDMASSLIRNDSDHEGISALWHYYRNWLDNEYPEAVLISEWSDPVVAIPAGFHVDSLLQFSEPYRILLGSESVIRGLTSGAAFYCRGRDLCTPRQLVELNFLVMK